MKKLIIIALALVSLQAIAQEKKEKHNKGERAEKMMNLPAEDIAANKTKKMTLFLDLNESQQTKIQKINLENIKNKKAMMAERKEKKESGDAKKPTPEERLKMANDRLDHKIAMKAKIKNILNDEQYAKWKKAQARMAMKQKDKKKDKGKKKAMQKQEQ